MMKVNLANQQFRNVFTIQHKTTKKYAKKMEYWYYEKGDWLNKVLVPFNKARIFSTLGAAKQALYTLRWKFRDNNEGSNFCIKSHILCESVAE